MKSVYKNLYFPNLVEGAVKIEDDRGFIEVLYESNNVVLKRTTSKSGVFRGMHVQPFPYLQNKIIRVVSGKILDFITDPSDEKEKVFYTEITPEDEWVHIDAKYAHGFYTPEDSVFEYLCDGTYNEFSEKAYRIDHLLLEKLQFADIILSSKDSNCKSYGEVLIKAL